MNKDFEKLRKKYDLNNMYSSISKFLEQFKEIDEISKSHVCSRQYKGIKNIIISGMGGSAIGGDIAKIIIDNCLKHPIIINRSYELPKWVDKNTLVIISSFSGNTEETISSFYRAYQQNAKIIVIASGGKLQDLAIKYSLDFFKLPFIDIQPRAALGYSMAAIIYMLESISIIRKSSFSDLLIITESLKDYKDNELDEILSISTKLYGKVPLIYSSNNLQAISRRFSGQLEENAKVLSFYSNFPEHNHNEIEGWSQNELYANFIVVWIRSQYDYERVKLRMDITRDLIGEFKVEQLEIKLNSISKNEELMKLIIYIDWISYFLSIKNKKDPSPVYKISRLKQKLEKYE